MAEATSKTHHLAVPDVSPCGIGKDMVGEVAKFALAVPADIAAVEWDHLIEYIRFLKDCQAEGFDNLILLARQQQAHTERMRNLLEGQKAASTTPTEGGA